MDCSQCVPKGTNESDSIRTQLQIEVQCQWHSAKEDYQSFFSSESCIVGLVERRTKWKVTPNIVPAKPEEAPEQFMTYTP